MQGSRHRREEFKGKLMNSRNSWRLYRGTDQNQRKLIHYYYYYYYYYYYSLSHFRSARRQTVSSGLSRPGRRGSNKPGPSPLSRSDESPDDDEDI